MPGLDFTLCHRPYQVLKRTPVATFTVDSHSAKGLWLDLEQIFSGTLLIDFIKSLQPLGNKFAKLKHYFPFNVATQQNMCTHQRNHNYKLLTLAVYGKSKSNCLEALRNLRGEKRYITINFQVKCRGSSDGDIFDALKTILNFQNARVPHRATQFSSLGQE